MNKAITLIIIFGVLMAFSLFGWTLAKSIIGENMLSPINEELKDVRNDLNLDPNIDNYMDDAVGYYNDLDIKADLLFLISWLVMEVLIIVMAANTPRLPKLSFLTNLMFITIVAMFVLNFIVQFSEWFIQEFINNIFTSTDTYLPIFNFYNTYQYIIVFFNLVGVLLINQMFSKKEETPREIDFGGGGSYKQTLSNYNDPSLSGGYEE